MGSRCRHRRFGATTENLVVEFCDECHDAKPNGKTHGLLAPTPAGCSIFPSMRNTPHPSDGVVYGDGKMLPPQERRSQTTGNQTKLLDCYLCAPSFAGRSQFKT